MKIFKLFFLATNIYINYVCVCFNFACSGVYKAKIKEIHQKIKHETNYQSVSMMSPMKAKKRKLEEEVV